MSAPVQYVRRLNLFDATMLVIGGIIGAGIFLNPAVVAQRTGGSALTLVVWVLGGLVALAGAFCFAELGARKPDAGGGYVYLRDAFGPLPAFLYGWTELLVINSGGIAASSATFATYTLALLGHAGSNTTLLAISAIALVTAVNYVGIRSGSAVQNLFTTLKLVALAALIAIGLFVPVAGARDPAILGVQPSSGGGLGAIGAALIPVLFAYGGWQSTNFVAGELRDPRKDLPRALILGVCGVVAVYVLSNVAYLRVLGIGGLAHSTAPASDVMNYTVGQAGSTLIAAGIAVSTFGFLNLAVLSAPRLYQAMAADGVFFGRAAALHPRFRAPTAALLIQGGWAILLLATKSYGQLLDYVVFGDWIFFGLVGATLFYYRRQSSPGTFRVPLYPILPAFFVAAALFTVASTVISNPRNAALGGVIIAAGVPAYLWWRTTGKREEGRGKRTSPEADDPNATKPSV